MTEQGRWLSQLLISETGMAPEILGEAHLLAGLRARMAACGTTTTEAYQNRVRNAPDELARLLSEMAVPETWFFREPAAFDLLAREAKGLPHAPRILCAPCSTGEEAYSAAIALRRAGIRTYHIDGVDLSQEAIDRAERGVYGSHAFRGTPAPALCDYIQAVPDQPEMYRIREQVRQGVFFRAANLHQGGTFAFLGQYDFIFCRNLLIYLLSQARMTLLQRLRDRLQPGGLLFTGHAELSGAAGGGLVPLREQGVFALRKTTRENPR